MYFLMLLMFVAAFRLALLACSLKEDSMVRGHSGLYQGAILSDVNFKI